MVIQNQGRHPVHLTWANATFFAAKSKQAKEMKDLGLKVKLVCTKMPLAMYVFEKACAIHSQYFHVLAVTADAL